MAKLLPLYVYLSLPAQYITDSSRLQGPSMEVTVGSGAESATWSIPKALLSHHSDYFRVACNGNFKEGIENRVTPHDVEPRLFQHFVEWLYFGTIPLLSDVERLYDGFRLWVPGDRLTSNGFKNDVMTQTFYLYEKTRVTPSILTTAEVAYCWNNSGLGSHLRLFLLDTFSQHWIYGEYMKADVEGWEALFLDLPDLHLRLTLEVAELCSNGKGRPKVKPLQTYLEAYKNLKLDCSGVGHHEMIRAPGWSMHDAQPDFCGCGNCPATSNFQKLLISKNGS
jgi:hypothetical protein